MGDKKTGFIKKFFEEFKQFALRGNVVDLAVGVIVGGAFTSIVNSLTENFINPLLNAIMAGGPGEGWTIGGAISAFITTIVNFLITALVLFAIVKALNSLSHLGKKKETPAAPKAPTTKICPYCKSEIAIDATRCPHCTSQLDK